MCVQNKPVQPVQTSAAQAKQAAELQLDTTGLRFPFPYGRRIKGLIDERILTFQEPVEKAGISRLIQFHPAAAELS